MCGRGVAPSIMSRKKVSIMYTKGGRTFGTRTFWPRKFQSRMFQTDLFQGWTDFFIKVIYYVLVFIFTKK